MKRTVFALAVALGTLAMAQPALAEAVVITYSDLDLTTQKGREELDRRLDRAAKQACGIDDVATGTRIVSGEARACYKDARKQIDKSLAAVLDNKAVGG